MNKKYYYIILIMIFFTGTLHSQIPVKSNKYLISAGMGVSLTNTPSFNDYLKEFIPYSNKDSIKSFSVGFEIFTGMEYTVNKKFSIKLDYSYFMKSLSYYLFYNYDYLLQVHQPYLMAYYVNRHTNFRFKFGAGAGYHFANLNRTISNASEINYKASGPAFRGEIIFSADMSKSLESYLSGYITGSMLGSLKETNGNILKNPTTGSEVNLGGYGAGVRLGFSIKL
ncbi:MAG: hypothetical protein EHM58_01860 [Ignavibacteriae bacterium]|nr:MAG: hypothetical protein EHM58_01860 [Ignavibacteriota bacterium]